MSDNNTDALKNWLVALTFIFLLFLISIFFCFLNIEGLSIDQRLDYGTKALTTTGTIFAGIAVFINAFYAAKRAEAMNKSAEAANESAKAALKNAEAALKNAQAAEDKQVTERFAKAIEQLGNEKIETRLGAIYTLERIAKDSPKDHWTIIEILTAFVREHVPLQPKEEKVQDVEQKPKMRTDIQAALTVIGRRNFNNDQKNQRLDLSYTDISDANLNEAKLQGAFLMGTNLQVATLMEANLQDSFLISANLQGAVLMEANLQGAVLMGANLQVANLQGANLTGAKYLTLQQIESAIGDHTTRLPDNLEAPSHWRSL